MSNSPWAAFLGAEPPPQAPVRADVAPVDRADAWQNILTGLGYAGRDARLAGEAVLDPVTPDEAEIMRRSDDIARRAVECLPDEGTRRGGEIASDDREAADACEQELERLGMVQAVAEAGAHERAGGGAAIFPVLNDQQNDLALPLDERRVVGLRALHVLEARELQPVAWQDSILDPQWRRPLLWRLTPSSPSGAAMSGTLIHSTRMVIFPGHRVTTRAMVGASSGWGDSVFTATRRVLRDFGVTWEAIPTILQTFSQGVLSMSGLAELIANGQSDVVQRRLVTTSMSKSILKMLVIDGADSYSQQQHPVSGLSDLLDRMTSRLSAALEMPVSMLMGEGPGGLNATGEHEIRTYYATTEAWQTRQTPRVSRIAKLVFISKDGPTGGREPKKWSWCWHPLWTPSEKEAADTRAVQAGVDEKYVDMGAPPLEILKARFGGDRYSADTSIDFDKLEAEMRAHEEASAQAAIEEEEDDGTEEEEDDGTEEEEDDGTEEEEDDGTEEEDELEDQRADAFNPNQPRAEDGRFGEVSGSGESKSKSSKEGKGKTKTKTKTKPGVKEKASSKGKAKPKAKPSTKTKTKASAKASKISAKTGKEKPEAKPSTKTKTKASAKASEISAKASKASKLNPQEISTDEHERMSAETEAKLSPQEKDAVRYYTGSGYSAINGALRKGAGSAAAIEAIKAMDEAFDKHELQSDAKVYRSINDFPPDFPFSKLKQGGSFTDKGYSSTTVDPNFKFVENGDAIRVEIHVPRGARAMSVGKLTNFSEEKELILNRGAKYKVRKIERDASGKVRHLQVELVSQSGWSK